MRKKLLVILSNHKRDVFRLLQKDFYSPYSDSKEPRWNQKDQARIPDLKTNVYWSFKQEVIRELLTPASPVTSMMFGINFG